METLNSLASYRLQRRLGVSVTACQLLAQTTEWGHTCASQYLARQFLVRAMSLFHLWCYWRWDRAESRSGTRAREKVL